MMHFLFFQLPPNEIRRGMRLGGLAQADGPSMSDFSAEKYATPEMHREKEIS